MTHVVTVIKDSLRTKRCIAPLDKVGRATSYEINCSGRGFQNCTDVWHFTQFPTNKKSELNTSTHQEFEREATPPPDEVASKKRQTKIQKNIRKIEADMKGALAETATKAPINGRANESWNLSQDRITDPVPFRLKALVTKRCSGPFSGPRVRTLFKKSKT